MLYLNAKVGVPMTSFHVFGEANYLGYGDNNLADYQVGVGYELLDNMAVDLD